MGYLRQLLDVPEEQAVELTLLILLILLFGLIELVDPDRRGQPN